MLTKDVINFEQLGPGWYLLILFKRLSAYSKFAMLEVNYWTIYYRESKTDDPPSSFLLIRVPSKTPCLVLHLAFLGGTPGYQRHEVVKQLKLKVMALKFPKRGPKAAEKQRRGLIVHRPEEKGKRRKAPLLREWSEIFCCVLLKKPVESVLLRFVCFHHTPQPLYNTIDNIKRDIKHHIIIITPFLGSKYKNLVSQTTMLYPNKMYRLYRKMTINGHFSI